MFKITCMKCGKETVYTEDGILFDTDNEDIELNTVGYDGQKQIICECGNSIEETY